MEDLWRNYFSIIEDTRSQCDVTHKLTDVLILIMCAVMCGIESLDEIVEYGNNKLEMLRQNFHIEEIPSKSTLSRILAMVDAEILGWVIINIMREMIGNEGEIIAIDGKAVRSTKRSTKKKSLHILTAMATENGVTIGQLAVDEKTNEIPCVQALLDLIDIKGKIITADAMHAQKETVSKVIKRHGDYCIGLKGNQDIFHTEVKEYILISFLIQKSW